jgi:hypothetical protein
VRDDLKEDTHGLVDGKPSDGDHGMVNRNDRVRGVGTGHEQLEQSVRSWEDVLSVL